jgi:hypothetical protein
MIRVSLVLVLVLCCLSGCATPNVLQEAGMSRCRMYPAPLGYTWPLSLSGVEADLNCDIWE